MRRLVVTATLALALAPAAHAAPAFIVSGHGWGHGVGMSQWGAQGLAGHGWRFGRILAHYYPGTRLAHGGNPRVRVLLVEDRRRVAISAAARLVVLDARGSKHHLRGGRLVLRAGHVRWPSPLVVTANAPLRLGARAYRGDLAVRAAGGRLSVVNRLPLEDYLRGVVPWEMPSNWHADALKAQAVAARTYALAHLSTTAPFDLYADTRSQMYGGLAAEQASTDWIVRSTAGIYVTWRGRPAKTYYDSTSGGRTESARDAFGEPLPYLPSVRDPYDSLSPHHSWRRRYSAGALAARLGVPAVETVITRKNRSGRVASLLVRWHGGRTVVTGTDVQRRLRLPSTWFRVLAVRG